MNVVGGKIKKERAILSALDKLDRFLRERVGHVFVHPARVLAARHPTDAADAVDDGHVMAVRVLELEQLRMFRASRIIADLALVTDLA